MFKLPDNIQYRVFDKTFKASTGRYVIKEDKPEIWATRDEVQKNLAAICEAQGAKEIAVLNQVHGADVYYAKNSTNIEFTPKMDALYTDQKNIILGIQTADCVPVLIADQAGNVIGAAHCGWKSAFHNILVNLVNAMRTKGAEHFMAIIGPSIHQESYEVSKEYFDIFMEESAQNTRFFIPSSNAEHFMFDIAAYVRLKLEMLGISQIYHISEDTYANVHQYPSYRRHCHTGEEYKSSILSTIVML